nr:tip elongation aberrant protein tea4 [Quercus suber]
MLLTLDRTYRKVSACNSRDAVCQSFSPFTKGDVIVHAIPYPVFCYSSRLPLPPDGRAPTQLKPGATGTAASRLANCSRQPGRTLTSADRLLVWGISPMRARWNSGGLVECQHRVHVTFFAITAPHRSSTAATTATPDERKLIVLALAATTSTYVLQLFSAVVAFFYDPAAPPLASPLGHAIVGDQAEVVEKVEKMSRPNIVRADTIDLQDQENPTASDHHKQSPDLNHSGLAAHQAAVIHRVREERHSEEQSLADVWNQNPDSTNDENRKQAEANGEQHDRADGTTDGDEHDVEEDAGEAENDGDDDMMDRISSSPSIDDGGYILQAQRTTNTAQWPSRSTSLAVSRTFLPEDFNSPATLSSTRESSRFLHSPQHMPQCEMSNDKHEDSLLSLAMQIGKSSLLDESSTLHAPVSPRKTSSPLFFTKHHHWLGRYDEDPILGTVLEENDESPYMEQDAVAANTIDWKSDPTQLPRIEKVDDSCWDGAPRVNSMRQRLLRPWIARIPSANVSMLEYETPSTQSMDTADALLPLDGPILDQPPPSPSETDSSWEDTSDSSSDSHDSAVDIASNDDANTFLDLDNRFIDSGWGGECLRDTEDIDFEFVYALHTFVATVEGQANATKGDTMVLLDDSNSYWWLVRVVKDSSIGEHAHAQNGSPTGGSPCIGYLPAEHIETPTERLARLNKHRNIDVGLIKPHLT